MTLRELFNLINDKVEDSYLRNLSHNDIKVNIVDNEGKKLNLYKVEEDQETSRTIVIQFSE